MKQFALSLVFAASLSGCATMGGGTQHSMTATFDPASIAWSKEKGTGSISGQAFFQTRGGQPRTCAGLEVSLIPYSEYAKERMIALYNGTTSGFNPAFGGRKPIFVPDEPAYYKSSPRSVCDAQGNFVFNNLPAGEYFVVTQIVWTVGNSFIPEGGSLMKHVELSEGEAARVMLTP